MNRLIVVVIMMFAVMLAAALLTSRSSVKPASVTDHASKVMKQRGSEIGAVYKEMEPGSNIYGWVYTTSTLAAN